MKILITGAAGFIGAHLVSRVAELGHEVVGVDSLNDYYDIQLKFDRLWKMCGIRSRDIRYGAFVHSETYPSYSFAMLSSCDRPQVESLFNRGKFDCVCHLASQAGVRYSIENPYTYIENNVNGFITILEGCRHNGIKRLLFASSSSVYGDIQSVPTKETDTTDWPISLYAATKKANELMAHAYSHLFQIPSIGMRFFTVYGPWGRPDMAPFIFIKSVMNGLPISLFNNGDMYRDFTYVDDVVEGITRLLFTDKVCSTPSCTMQSPDYDVFNIGNHSPVNIGRFIKSIERSCGVKAVLKMMPKQPGDVRITYADVDKLHESTGFVPSTSVDEGVDALVRWYMEYYGVRSTQLHKS